MAKTNREFSITDIYHIIFRGNDKSDIFYDNQDRHIFLEKVRETKEKFEFKVYAYCLMDNHIHMVIKVKDEYLSNSMQSLEIRYMLYFNKKFNRCGHLFQDRFISKRVENLDYFLTVCKYIHRNPEKANMEKTENYEWSSYKEYVGKQDIVEKNVLLHYFNNDLEEFNKYTLKNDDQENAFDFTEFEMKKRLSEEEVSNIIVKKFELKNASDVSLQEHERRDEIIRNLKDLQGTSVKQLARITKVTAYYIRKIWEKE